MITQEHIDRILDGNGNVVDQDGNKVGSAGQVYVDDHTGEPSWVTVRTGLFGTSESFAPLQGASMDGDDVRIAFTRDQVKDAPKVNPEQNLSEAEEEELYRHYALSRPDDGGYDATADRDVTHGGDDASEHGTYSGATTGSDDMGDSKPGIANVGSRDPYDADPGDLTVGRSTSGPFTDDALSRSEEQPHVGTESREAGRARLRRYVVTENVPGSDADGNRR